MNRFYAKNHDQWRIWPTKKTASEKSGGFITRSIVENRIFRTKKPPNKPFASAGSMAL